MINFIAENNASPQIEMITVDQVSVIYDHVSKSEGKYRFEIDTETL
ncbi:hypothetical protein [Enterococcus haemoperoxidus]|nr:hypothetical protein [Enterococcus haemoperoxidus]OJG55832.1 hypothetical protein RV06_GL001414 [Enterococcus haemoperoxidus]